MPLIATQVWQSRDTQAYLQAKALKRGQARTPRSASSASGSRCPAIKYLVAAQSPSGRKKAGLTVSARQDNPSDDVTGGEKAGERAAPAPLGHRRGDRLQRPLCSRGVIAARSATGTVTVIGLNGSSDGISAVKAGRLAATVQVDPIGIGVQTARAAYSLITKQNLPLPPSSCARDGS